MLFLCDISRMNDDFFILIVYFYLVVVWQKVQFTACAANYKMRELVQMGLESVWCDNYVVYKNLINSSVGTLIRVMRPFTWVHPMIPVYVQPSSDVWLALMW